MSSDSLILPAWPYSPFIAHRGAGDLAPENTLAAMRVGAREGFTMFEFDVKLSADNIAILMHDDDVDRTSNGHGPARAHRYSELSLLDAGAWHSPCYAGEPVPSFLSVARFTRANDIACNVEIKPCPGRAAETGAVVADLCATYWRDASVLPLLSSFEETALAAAQRVAPHLPRALLIERVPTDWAERLKTYDCVALNINQTEATPALIQAVHQAGYRIAAWTVNDPARARQLLEWGIDALFTDNLTEIRPNPIR